MPQRAFTALFAAHRLALLRYAEHRLADRQVAEDMVAETFELAWTRVLAGQEIDRRWLFAAVGFKLRDHRKRCRRRQAAEAALQRLVEEPIEHLSILDRIAVHTALRALTQREREAVALTYWIGLTASDVATMLRCTPSSVWVTLSRARAKLRGLLAPEIAIAYGEQLDSPANA